MKGPGISSLCNCFFYLLKFNILAYACNNAAKWYMLPLPSVLGYMTYSWATPDSSSYHWFVSGRIRKKHFLWQFLLGIWNYVAIDLQHMEVRIISKHDFICYRVSYSRDSYPVVDIHQDDMCRSVSVQWHDNIINQLEAGWNALPGLIELLAYF